MENNIMKSYLKPEIIEETSLERKLVYAEPETKRMGCTTVVGKIDSETEAYT